MLLKKEKKPIIKSIQNSLIEYSRFKFDYPPFYPPFQSIDAQ